MQHLALDRILEVRDGAKDSAAEGHLAECAACSEELERLRELRQRLRALPAARPSRDHWTAVRLAYEARRRRRFFGYGGAGLALAASITLAVLIGRLPGPAPRGEAPNDLAVLMRQSQQLEDTFRRMNPQDGVLDLRSASRMADLQDQIALIDSSLAPSGRRRVSPDMAERLWRQRVGLMNELVRARDVRPAYVGL